MRSHPKYSDRNRRAPRKKSNRIIEMSRKDYQKTQAYMRRVVNFGSLQEKQIPSKNIKNGQPSLKSVNNSVANGVSKLPSSKGMNKATTSRLENHLISAEKQKDLSRIRLDGKVGFARKRESNDVSLSRLKKQESSNKHEFSKGSYMVSKDNCTTEGNKRQDEVAIDKENTIKFGDYHKEGDTKKQPLSEESHCNSMSKKRKEPLSEENPRPLNENDHSVGEQVHKLSCEQIKKPRQSIVIRKDDAEDGVSNLNHVGVDDDTTSISKNDHTTVLVSSRVERQCYSCLKPIDKPSWSGIFKTDDKEYASLDGHLSTKSCEKAWSLSRQLLKMVEVKKLSRLEVWPKAWGVSTPTGDDIGIYFFPHEMRQDDGWDQLVREVMENDLALQTIIGEAEMLIFPSILLPIHHQTFQRKHYLWGVFKRRKDKGVVVENPLNTMGRCEKEKQQNIVLDEPNYMLPVEKTNQEMSSMMGSIPLEIHMLATHERTQEVEASHLKGPTNNDFGLKHLGDVGQVEGPHPVATDAASFLANHGHIASSMGDTPGRLMGFVVRKTPKLDQIIREMEQEGALVFAMQGEMVGAGSWAGSKATATQK